jgi:hypothetical protein
MYNVKDNNKWLFLLGNFVDHNVVFCDYATIGFRDQVKNCADVSISGVLVAFAETL